MIKAIIFDCFGVLTTDRWLQFKDQYLGNSADLKQQAIDYNKQADRGLLSHDEFIEKIAALAHLSPAETRRLIEGSAPNTKLFEHIRDKLKPYYKIGMLSNASGNWLDEIFTDDQIKLFDEIVLSFSTGFIKPQTEIYKLAASKLDAELGECVFVDDRAPYCEVARKLGMSAIRYQDFNQFKRELDKILGTG